MLWFIILTTVMNTGEVYTEVRPASNPDFNNEKTCNEAGEFLAAKEQTKIGTDSGKVYYICSSISKEQFNKVVGANGTDI